MPRPSKPPRNSLAAHADRHALYEIATQRPIAVIEMIERAAERRMDRPPVTLREDFAGTAYLASMWVRSHHPTPQGMGKGKAKKPRDDEASAAPVRRAVAVDSDAAMIRCAQRHNRGPLGEAAGRLRLIRADVMECGARADVVVSLNFSHFIYHTRPDLVAYLRHARRCIKPGGMILLDAYGGPGAMTLGTQTRRFGDFTYHWEQAAFDPATHLVTNHIHFTFPDQSRLERAFTYRWRLWSIPELTDALEEARFTDIQPLDESPAGFAPHLNPAEHNSCVAYLLASR